MFDALQPEGGVERGDKMTITFQQQVMPTESTPLTSDDPVVQPNRGDWKDGLCECCTYSCCHPSLLNAWCFPQILMAQVLTRLRMNWLGDPAPESEWKHTFRRVIILLVLYLIVMIFMAPPVTVVHNGVASTPNYPSWKRITYNVVSLAFWLYSIIVLTKTRRAVRDKYDIPTKACGGAEDCCCSFWCGCCTVAQVARQTADYPTTKAQCCSSTGLPADVPVVIV